MFVPTRTVLVLLATAAFAACETRPSTGLAGGSTASVRFVNATPNSLDIATNGSVSASNRDIGSGASSGCIGVDAASANLTVRSTGTTTALPGFTPLFSATGRFIVVAYLDAAGTTQFATFASDTFTPTSGQGGLRVFDAARGTGTFDVYLSPPGAAPGTPSATNLSFGGGTSFFNVDPASTQVTLTTAGSRSAVFNAGVQSVTAGQNYILVIAPPATGSAGLRSFLVSAC